MTDYLTINDERSVVDNLTDTCTDRREVDREVIDDCIGVTLELNLERQDLDIIGVASVADGD